MVGGVEMSLLDDVLEDNISFEEMERREKREIESLEASTKTGSGIKPDKLKIFNRHLKQHGLEPLTLREYLKNKEIFDHDIDPLLYEVYCTQNYLNEVFGVEIEENHSVNISCSMFCSYYEEGNTKLEYVENIYPKVLQGIKTAHDTSLTKLHQTKETLIALGIQEDEIPVELKAAIYVRKKYAKNQRKQALKDILVKLLPQINNKIILEEIATNALH